MRKILNIFIILFYVILPFGLLSFYERLNYPKVLFSTPEKLNHFSEADMETIRNKCSEPLELSHQDEKIYIRCGLFWPKAKIYVVDIKNSAHIFKNFSKE